MRGRPFAWSMVSGNYMYLHFWTVPVLLHKIMLKHRVQYSVSKVSQVKIVRMVSASGLFGAILVHED